MKKLKKVGVIVSVVAAMLSMFCINTSAATINDGLKAEIQVEASNSNDTSIKALLSNQNYYEIDGVNMILTVSDNAVLNGNVKLSDINLSADQQKSFMANVSLKQQPQQTTEATQTTQSTTQAVAQETTQAVQSTTQSVTQAATQAAVNSTAPSNAVTIGNSKKDNTAVQTGNKSFMLFAGALAVIIVGVVMIVSFKKGKKRVISIMLCATLTLSVVSVSIGTVGAAETSRKTFAETQQILIDNQTVTLTLTVDYPQQAEIHDNSLADILKLNNGNVDKTLYDDNTISFLNAEYTDYKVTNVDTAINSLSAVSTLLGINDKAVSIIPLYSKTLDNGDVFYTFQQNVGPLMLGKSFIVVGADKDGNTICVSNSLNADAGAVELSESIVSAEQAESAAIKEMTEMMGECKLAGVKPTLDIDQSSDLLCWVVCVEKVFAEGEKEEANGRFYNIYISAKDCSPVSLTTSAVIEDKDSINKYNNDNYFKNVDTQMMTFTDYMGKTVELPVAQNENGLYYFCDTQRRILCSDTAKTNTSMIPAIFTFSSPKEVSSIYVSVFENIRIAYDWYLDRGIKSIDGNGIPLLINLGNQKQGIEEPNAYYTGIKYGWGTFLFSNTSISTELDLAAHEYTHGVKSSTTGVADYSNVSGAIEESYADILGNFCEMLTAPDECDTETWEIGENTGNTLRSMSNPHMYKQPEYIGDAFYIMPTKVDGALEDHGGVHANNSILSYICYKMYENGMAIEDDFNVWFNTLAVFLNNANFDDVCAYVKFSAERNGLSQYTDTINMLFDNAKIDNVNDLTWKECSAPDGFTKVIFNMENMPKDDVFGVNWTILNNYNGQVLASQDADGSCGIINANGKALFLLGYHSDVNSPLNVYAIETPVNKEYNYILEGGEITINIDFQDLLANHKK